MMHVSNLMRQMVLTAAYYLGIFRLFDWINRKTCRVVTYHGVSEDAAKRISGMDTVSEVLEAQLIAMQGRYKLVRLDEFCNIREPTIAITFDDGNLSDLTRANPLLERLGIKATFFVCADLVKGRLRWTWNDMATVYFLRKELEQSTDQSKCIEMAQMKALEFETNVRATCVTNPSAFLMERFADLKISDLEQTALLWDEERLTPLNENHVSELAKADHLIGSHSKTHAILSHLTEHPKEIVKELRGSADVLNSINGVRVTFLSYPFGGKDDVGPEVSKAAREAGYIAAFCNYITDSKDQFQIGRMSLPHSRNAVEIFAVTSGFNHFLKTGSRL